MSKLKDVVRRIPGVHKAYRYAYRHLRHAFRVIRLLKSPFLKTYPPGHYHSPIPDLDVILEKENLLFREDVKTCPGIDLREGAQLDLLSELATHYDDLPFSEQPIASSRYYYENMWFNYADAIVLFGMLRHFKPSKVIEVGSGFSSAVMLDTNDAFDDALTHFTFIEPFPHRLNRFLSDEDKNHCAIVANPVQDVEIDLFDTLDENDILSIDSSHVVKVGSDVARILFEILPRLKPGVIVHFHDILWPFEYPKEWFIDGRAWNEAYFLRAFLQYNNSFEILYFNAFMELFHRDRLKDMMPLCLRKPQGSALLGGSLWLTKTG